jgi:hypothetical protein
MDRIASIDEWRSIAAGRDPRQTHFSFWVDEAPSAPNKKRPIAADVNTDTTNNSKKESA